MTQTFFKGDLVQLSEMPLSMRHFDGNCKAIVIETYEERYGQTGKNFDKEYTLFVLKNSGGGEVVEAFLAAIWRRMR
jgi:hypothetical protein